MQRRLHQLLDELVAINSVSPTLTDGPGEAEIVEYIAILLRDIGLNPEVQTVAPKRANVVVTIAGTDDAPALLLNAHVDTVGTEGMDDPFTVRREGDRLYGRGTYDMKGSVAVMLVLAERLVETPPPGDVILTFVADEEDHSIGTEYLVENWLPTLDEVPAGAFVLEPTEETIGVAHKGFAWLEVDIEGRAAHGSRPTEGVDAIMPLGAALGELGTIRGELRAREADSLLGHASLHASLIRGGTAWSVYPAGANLKWERRTRPGETTEDLRRELSRVLDTIERVPGEHSASGTLVFERLPHTVSVDSLPVTLLQQADSQAEITGMTFWTDAALLGQAGIPSVIYGPKGHGPHAVDEWVSLESLERVTRVLEQCIRSV